MVKTLATIILCVVITLGIVRMTMTDRPVVSNEPVYDRVMRTGVIRCGYFIVPPEFNVDAQTHKMSGIAYDITEAVAKELGLRVDWVEEVGFADMTAGLQTGRYDAVCSSVFNRPDLARQANFTIPFMYTPVGAFVRNDDMRFGNGLKDLNQPTLTIASIDGVVSEEITAQDFPLVRRYSLPQHTDISMLLESVATKKADIAFTYMANFYRYNDANPNVLKQIDKESPVRAFGNTIMLPKGESDLKNMIDTTLSNLINSGRVDEIISRYEKHPNTYFRVNRGYKTR